MQEHPKVLQQAISKMVLKQPFYAAILLMTKLERDDSVGTAGTDCYSKIVYNKEFVESLSLEHAIFVLAHETEHIVRLHGNRQGSRPMARWNIAADHSINLDLMAMGLKGPVNDKGEFLGVADPQYKNMAEEKIYRLMPEPPEPPPGGGSGEDGGESAPGGGSGDPDNVFAGDMKPATNSDGQPLSEAEKDALDRATRGKVLQAAAQVKATKGIGSLPAHLRDQLVELMEPQVDWRDVLRDFIKARSTDDYSWARLNRRVRHRGLRMPSLDSEVLGGVGVVIDTSGSCHAEIPRFISELAAIASEAKPQRIVVIFMDLRVQLVIDTSWDEFEADTQQVLKRPPFGGGTDLRPGFALIEQEYSDLDCVVCLTDMYTPWPESFSLGNQTLFVDSEDDQDQPFGRKVVLNDEV